MSNQVAIEKNNAMTQLLHKVKQMNQERGSLAGKSSGTPMVPMGGTRVLSAKMQAPPELPPEEKERLDNEARAIGILPPDEDESPQYFLPTEGPSRQTAREFMSSPTPREAVAGRFIDFQKVQGIDLHRNVAYVDGFEIDIPVEHSVEFKKYVIDLAVAHVTKQLAEAIATLNENMQRVSDGTAEAEILSKDKELTSETKSVQNVRRKGKRTVGTRKSKPKKRVKEKIRPLSEGDSEVPPVSP